uniref:Uncharacterized protein n=1 Tax=Setaria digitata TaxID=48799 RepID=A0A915Q4E3_9BILA
MLPPETPWHSRYEAGKSDEKSVCYGKEQATEHLGKHLRRIRLDGGFRSFWKYWQADATVTPSQCFTCSKNGQRKMNDSRTAIRSYPTYTESSLRKSMLECLRTDSFPVLNFKQSFSTLRGFKRQNLG